MRARVLAIAFLFGCGGDGVEVNTNQDNVCDEFAEVACHNMYECCSEGQIENALNVSEPRSEAECRVDLTRQCKRAIARLDDGIAQKRLRFDAKLLNACFEAALAPGGTCATVESALPTTDACIDSAWIGLVENGGSCTLDVECASEDSFCAINRTCVPLPTDQQPCLAFSSGERCASGLFCDGVDCRMKVGPGANCFSSLECQEGLFCDTMADLPTCTAVHALGDACIRDDACDETLQCNPGACSNAARTCFTSSDCGLCDDDNSACMNDLQCSSGLGRCAVTGELCSQSPCIGGDACVFPKCNLGTCEGSPTCGERHLVVDYCADAFPPLPGAQPLNQGGG